MQYVNLGKSAAKVSRLCLGTMNFGPQCDEDQSHTIMDRALELGINFFDTADVYGWKRGEGITENIIGRWLAKGDKRRERVVLATKFYGPMGEGPNDVKVSALYMRRACEASLQRLQTDCIDLYQMHHIWREAQWDEVWAEYERLYSAGKIVYAGSSNFAGWHLAKANENAARRAHLGLVSEQSLYNLTQRSLELEVLPAARDYGIGIIPWSPLGGGLLGGVLSQTDQGVRRAAPRLQAKIEELRPQLERYEAFCHNLGCQPGQIALAWLLHQPGVTAPIIGPRTLEQLDQAVAALDITLSEEQLRELDSIFPGPGGPAPEAYAW